MMRIAVIVTTALLAVSTLASAALAASDIGFYGFGARVGFVMPEDPIESTFGLGIQVDLGTITENVYLGAVAEYWGKSYEASAGFYEVADWSWSEITIAATARYMFPTHSSMRPYVGGEVGFAIGSWDWEYNYASLHYDESGSNTDISFAALGGLEIPVSSSMNGFFEAKYHIDGVDYFGVFGGLTILMGR